MTTPLKNLGILLFPGFELLDVFGPLEIFSMVPDKLGIKIIAEQQGLIQSGQGTSVLAEYSWQSAPHLDLLMVPGGQGTRREVANIKLLDWLRLRASHAELILSVCTGAALLAKAGILDNHKATSNKIAFDWVKSQGPKVEWQKKARWVDDGPVITSSGVSAGIDMSLYLLARLYGKQVQDEAARKAEYVMNKDPTDDPFMMVEKY